MIKELIITGFLPLVLCLSIFQLNCYEEEEGCKDVRAVNYDVIADKNCEDCCTYPSLVLSAEHLFGTEIIDTNTVFYHNNDSIRIKSLNFYLSDFVFLAENEGKTDSASIIETISVQLPGNNDDSYHDVVFPVAKINLGRTDDYTIGSLKKEGVYTAIHIDFGIRESINSAGMDRIETSNSLYQNQDSMYINQDEGFYFLKMTIAFSDGAQKKIAISGEESLKSLEFSRVFDFSSREERQIFLTVHYDKWFESINFRSESSISIAEKLKNKLDEAIIFE